MEFENGWLGSFDDPSARARMCLAIREEKYLPTVKVFPCPGDRTSGVIDGRPVMSVDLIELAKSEGVRPIDENQN